MVGIAGQFLSTATSTSNSKRLPIVVDQLSNLLLMNLLDGAHDRTRERGELCCFHVFFDLINPSCAWYDAAHGIVHQGPTKRRSARYGSLVWKNSAAATEALANSQCAAGASVKLVEASTVRALEPNLICVPELAAFSPDDIAIDPVDLTRTLAEAARTSGAVARWGQAVMAIEALPLESLHGRREPLFTSSVYRVF